MKNDELKIAFLDVGHGDSIVIVIPNRNRKKSAILIDVKQFLKVKKFLDDNNIYTIEKIIITHSHIDHSGGVTTLIDKLIKEGKEVKQIVYSPDRFNTKSMGNKYKILIRGLNMVLNNQKIESISPIIDKLEKIIFYDKEINLKLKILYPNNSDLIDAVSRNNINDSSVVIEVDYNEYKILLPGDLEAYGWKRFYKRYISSKFGSTWNILKLPHHGDYYDKQTLEEMSTEQIINFVSPQIGIISSGQNKLYVHPNINTIKILKQAGIKIFCTEVTNICDCNITKNCPCSGNIIFTISDSIKIEPLEKATLNLKSNLTSPQCI